MLTSGRWAPRPPVRQRGGDDGDDGDDGGHATHELRGDGRRQRHENRERKERSGEEEHVGAAPRCRGAGGAPNAGPDAGGSWCCTLETLMEKKKQTTTKKPKQLCVCVCVLTRLGKRGRGGVAGRRTEKHSLRTRIQRDGAWCAGSRPCAQPCGRAARPLPTGCG